MPEGVLRQERGARADVLGEGQEQRCERLGLRGYWSRVGLLMRVREVWARAVA